MTIDENGLDTLGRPAFGQWLTERPIVDRERVARWADVRNILCVRLDYLGDVLMTTPAIRALRNGGPGGTGGSDRRITLLTSDRVGSLPAMVPEIDDVIVYDAPWIKASTPRKSSSPELAMVNRLRALQFDAAVIFTVYSQNPLPAAFCCYLADIPLRLAYCHENPYQLLTDWIKDPEPEAGIRHEVRRQLDLVAQVGCRTDDERMRLRVSPTAFARVQQLLDELEVDLEKPWLVIHPGVSAPSRRYPSEAFAAVAETLVRERGVQVVFTGSEREMELVRSIQEAMAAPSHTVAGVLDLQELAALLAMAPVLISNNTGPAHIAAGVGTSVVDLYAMTNPQHTPWGVPSRVLFYDVPCKFCYRSICPEGHHHCLRRVPPEAVVQAACELLDEAAGRAVGEQPVAVRGG